MVRFLRPDWQACGIGRALQRRRMDYARGKDVKGFSPTMFKGKTAAGQYPKDVLKFWK
jgi:hypothetical protein